ncbi:hypothetical protein TRFO_20255 [Tritrichomonas foetus]|uniref:Uncharacterized protein n=1 Tax=Tritrichomonas foetus TaxID=1144522 RepID=A0A1J4KHL9_9EUKA|nr:hypothetical protein TRFO_20255 [Tritrichomonas foetus]|eukprot:OHT10448.1 hypothetical protein TRFO_20255 [Tritrichomonas foetus]
MAPRKRARTRDAAYTDKDEQAMINKAEYESRLLQYIKLYDDVEPGLILECEHPFEVAGLCGDKPLSPIQKAITYCMFFRGGSASDEEIIAFFRRFWKTIGPHTERKSPPNLRILHSNLSVTRDSLPLFIPDDNGKWMPNSLEKAEMMYSKMKNTELKSNESESEFSDVSENENSEEINSKNALCSPLSDKDHKNENENEVQKNIKENDQNQSYIDHSNNDQANTQNNNHLNSPVYNPNNNQGPNQNQQNISNNESNTDFNQMNNYEKMMESNKMFKIEQIENQTQNSNLNQNYQENNIYTNVINNNNNFYMNPNNSNDINQNNNINTNINGNINNIMSLNLNMTMNQMNNLANFNSINFVPMNNNFNNINNNYNTNYINIRNVNNYSQLNLVNSMNNNFAQNSMNLTQYNKNINMNYNFNNFSMNNYGNMNYSSNRIPNSNILYNTNNNSQNLNNKSNSININASASNHTSTLNNNSILNNDIFTNNLNSNALNNVNMSMNRGNYSNTAGPMMNSERNSSLNAELIEKEHLTSLKYYLNEIKQKQDPKKQSFILYSSIPADDSNLHDINIKTTSNTLNKNKKKDFQENLYSVLKNSDSPLRVRDLVPLCQKFGDAPGSFSDLDLKQRIKSVLIFLKELNKVSFNTEDKTWSALNKLESLKKENKMNGIQIKELSLSQLWNVLKMKNIC